MPSTGNREKVMGIRHRTRKILLGSLLAHSASLTEEWKSSEQVIAFVPTTLYAPSTPEDGKILWASDEAKGRESIGFFSGWKDSRNAKGIKKQHYAADVSKRKLHSTLEYIDAA